jgi:hypothetical protein
MKTYTVLRITLLLSLSAALIASAHPAQAYPRVPSPVTYAGVTVLGVHTHVVTVDLNDQSVAVSVALSNGGPRTTESFGSMVSRWKPAAAITGTFFCTRSLTPVGDIVREGMRINTGAIGACLGFTSDNKVRVAPGEKGKNVDWTGCDSGVRTGPLLLSSGRITVNARREGFHDTGLFGRRVRAAIGVTSNNKLLLVAVKTPVTFTELAKVMLHLGAVNAINLDGGSSTALSFGERIVVHPGRRMTNVIVVGRRKPTPAPVAVAGQTIKIELPPPAPQEPALRPSIDRKTTEQSPNTITQAPEQHALLPTRLGDDFCPDNTMRLF